MDFLEYLVKQGLITKEELLSFSKTPFTFPEEALQNKVLPQDKLLKAKEEYYKVPGRSLASSALPDKASNIIPEKTVDLYKLIPIGIKGGLLEIGMVNPDDIRAQEAIDFIISERGLAYKIFVITLTDFEHARGSYEKLETEVGSALKDLESELTEKSKGVEVEAEKSGTPTRIVEDAPITKIVATILRYATEGGASDVHIEPLESQVRVRFRIDGVMHTSLMLPKDVESAVGARIKILSNMKLDEKRKPQDGRFSAHIDGKKIDFRVSTFPTSHGEKVVMRILNPEAELISLAELGFSDRDLTLIREAINLPYGLILISGPTGSGKTTTLYAMLNEIDKDTRNVLSLEDPVEYNIPGISQSSVRPEIGYTFATGLRTILRQDPDIIMVGEIRDKETAQLAIQAALTGHLVLSTIHTNNAIGVVPRLIDMGVDPYLIAPTLALACAQRLVRKLCPGAGKPLPIEGSVKEIISHSFTDLPPDVRARVAIPEYVYEASPSSECPNGTRGRMAVFEAMRMTKEVEDLILSNPTENALYEAARRDGMLTMREDAILKAFRREIPFEEINSV